MRLATAVLVAPIAVLAASLAASMAATAKTETCAEKFQRMLVERNPTGPVKITVTQEVKGAPATRNINWQAGPGHWMTEMVEPASMPWTLVADGVMYASSDKGKTWQKVRDLDAPADGGQSRRNLEAAAATVKDAVCGTEPIGGVPHETVAASYAMPAYKTEHRDKYWIDPATGWIARAESTTRMTGFESTATQIIEKAPGLELPTPN